MEQRVASSVLGAIDLKSCIRVPVWKEYFDYLFVRGVGVIIWFVLCRPAAPLIMSIVIYLNVIYNLWKICDLQQFWGTQPV